MAKSVGSIRLDFVAGIQGLEQVQSKFAAAEGSIKGGAARIGDSFSASAIKTATLELRVDTLKRSYASLASTIQSVGVGTQAQYEKLEDSARKLEIANQRLAQSYRSVGTPAAKPAEEGGSGFNARFAILGAKDVLEGRMTNAFAEAINEVMRFKGALLGVGVGAIGLIAIIYAAVTLKEKLTELESAPSKLKAAFRDLNDPLRTTNDELAVTNDRLQNQIAKLEGRRQNTLKLSLDEAVVSADKLTSSLGKALENLEKLLKEQSVGLFRQFIGESGTKDLQKELFGEEKFAGHGGFTGRVEDITDRGQEKLRAAKTEQERKKAQDQLDGELRYAYDEEINALRSRAKGIQDARDEEKKRAVRPGSTIAPEQTKDTAILEGSIRGAIRNLEVQRSFVGATRENVAFTGRKEELEANKSNGKPGDVIAERLQALRDRLGEVQAKLEAVGQTDAFRAQVEGIADGIKAVDQLNKELKQYHQTLDPANEAKVKAIALQIKQTEVETQYQTKLATSDRDIANRITSLYLLADATNKGYEATKRASVETALAQKFGENFTDPKRQSDIEQQRQGLRAVYDKEHANQIKGTVEGLGEQIKLEKDLAAAQSLGAEATRLVALQHRLEQIAKEGGVEATKKLVQAEIDLYNAQRANLSSEQIAKLNQRLEAIKAISAAEAKGAEAVRQATLEAKYAELAKSGASPAEVTATRGVDEAQHQQEITSEAAKRANVYRDQLEKLNEQVQATEKLRGTEADQVGVELALKELEDQRLQIIAHQALAVGTLTGGYKAFFTTIEQEAEKPGKILYDGMHSAVDRASSELSKLATGQKTEWKRTFQDLGQQIIKAQIESDIKKALGSIADRFPQLKLPGAAGQVKRPTGNPNDLIHVYDHAKDTGTPKTSSSPATPPFIPIPVKSSPSGQFGDGYKGGFIFSVFSDLFKKKSSGVSNTEHREPSISEGLPRLPSGLIDRTGRQDNATEPTQPKVELSPDLLPISEKPSAVPSAKEPGHPTGKIGDPVHVSIDDKGTLEQTPGQPIGTSPDSIQRTTASGKGLGGGLFGDGYQGGFVFSAFKDLFKKKGDNGANAEPWAPRVSEGLPRLPDGLIDRTGRHGKTSGPTGDQSDPIHVIPEVGAGGILGSVADATRSTEETGANREEDLLSIFKKVIRKNSEDGNSDKGITFPDLDLSKRRGEDGTQDAAKGNENFPRLPDGLIDRTGIPAKKPTGNPGDPVHVTQDSDSSGPLAAVFGQGLAAGGGLASILGSLGGGAGAASAGTESVSSTIEFGGFLAKGGDMVPGSAYMVGEYGPELVVPRNAGTVIPNHQLGGSGGDTHIHNYDLRNADIGAAGRLRQMQQQTELSAVRNSQAVAAETNKRTPKGAR